MKMPFFEPFKEKEKRHQILVLLGVIYSYSWSIIKIVIGLWMETYFLLLSGISTLFVGMNKHIYMHSRNQSSSSKKTPYLMASFLAVIGLSYLLYSLRFFFSEGNKAHSIVLAIVIATLSFFEFGYSLYRLVKERKKNDIVSFAFRMMSFATSLFALANTQAEILMALGHQANIENGSFGVAMGSLSILLSVSLFLKTNRVSLKK